MRITSSLFGIVIVAVVAVACGSDAESNLNDDPQSDPSVEVSGEVSDFERMLSHIPDTHESRARTRINRVAAIAEAMGLTVPGQFVGEEELLNFKVQFVLESDKTGLFIQGDGWLTGFSDHASVMPDTKTSLGFDTRDIEVAAVVGEALATTIWPPLEVILGDIDSELANRLLEDCSGCPEQPEVIEIAGESYYSWGEDFIGDLQLRFALPAFDFLGRGGRLYFGDGFVGRSVETAEIEKFVDLTSGTSRTITSLADKEDWSLAADALDELGALSAVFTERADNRVLELPEYLHFEERILRLPVATELRYERYDEIAAEVVASAPELPAPLLVAAGFGFMDGVSSAVIAVVYVDDEKAERVVAALRSRAVNGLAINADLTTTPWSELIESAQIEAVGRVVSVRVVPVPRSNKQQRLALAPFSTAFPFFTDVPYIQFLLR